MFIPLRRTGLLFKVGKKDVHGDVTYQSTAQQFGWAPIYLRNSTQDSGVRADSSASRGRADENIIDFRLIVEKKVTPENGDKIVLDGNKVMKVIKVHERMDIVGRLHHWEVDCGAI